MMNPCWVFMILVGFRISDAATQGQNTCTFNDKLKSVCVAAGDSVSVPCPNMTGEDFRLNLFKDQELIYNHSCSHNNKAPDCKLPLRVDLQLHKKTDNDSVSFLLIGVNASRHGVYRCEGQVRFPPPLLPAVPGAASILVLIEGHQCKVPKQESSDNPWIWILALVSVILYSVIITVSAVFFWVKLRKTDSQSDYMNTKPRAPRGQRKNRGVQNPAPRYF
ncbi:T-cell-specific surface glycoprotein CD28-like [Labrus mixtus]|uniref:T-cell-specific surface glycoprotein CD28-like n=1 Tax=Labrus mixtus TaxID=508554 RepID=UPI0029BFCF31|nr:T-cell-specific surface glycoprotein CD28-like [Labrus mixtus]